MQVGFYLSTNDEKKRQVAICNFQKLYDNLMDISSILYCSCSEFVEICDDRGATVFEKLEEIKRKAMSAIERVDTIGLTNPDFNTSENRTGTLAKKMKIAKRGEVKC